ncbi:hypothetical protein TNCV_4436241 [Trichonephila clavipes]|nr:hypothetical protein TNCV_4436241 [Trichonephila clavipes]
MVSLDHPSFPPTDLGRLDDEDASPGGRPLQAYEYCVVPPFDIPTDPLPPLAGCNEMLKRCRSLIPEARREREPGCFQPTKLSHFRTSSEIKISLPISGKNFSTNLMEPQRTAMEHPYGVKNRRYSKALRHNFHANVVLSTHVDCTNAPQIVKASGTIWQKRAVGQKQRYSTYGPPGFSGWPAHCPLQ